MPTLAEVRAKFPQYNDMSDTELGDALHRKFYSDMDRGEFDRRIGLASAPKQDPAGVRPSQGTPKYGFMDESVNAYTLGLGDEIAALGRAAGSYIKGAFTGAEPKGYSAQLEDIQADRRQYREDNPVASTVAQVGGGLGTMALTPALKVGGAVTSGAATGAAYGGALGFNEGEGGLDARLGSAMQGVGYGAGIGAAIPVAGKVIGSVLRGPMNAVKGVISPEGYAAERVGAKLAQDNVDLATLGPQLDAARAAGATEVAIADLAGDNTRRLLRTATNISGPGREQAVATIRDRMASLPDRVQSAIRSSLADPESLYPTMDRLTEQARVRNAPAYERAYNSPIAYDDFALDDLMRRVPSQAITEANRLMKVEGVKSKQILADLADDGSVTFREMPDVRQWDYIKRGMDEIIRAEDGKGAMGSTSAYGRAVGRLRDDILSILDEKVPAFAEARAGAAESIQLRKAAESGREFLTQDIEQTRRALGGMNDQQREMARIGFARAMKDKLYTNDMRDATAAVWNRRTREVFNELFKTPEDRANFERFMAAERGQIATRDAVRGNSTTAAQMADMVEEQGGGQGVAGYLLDQFRGGAVSGVANIARDALGRASGLNEKSGAEITRLLMGQAPDAQAAILRAIAERQASQKASAQSRAALGRLLSRGLIAGTVPQQSGQ